MCIHIYIRVEQKDWALQKPFFIINTVEELGHITGIRCYETKQANTHIHIPQDAVTDTCH